jgi:hypothetical protein
VCSFTQRIPPPLGHDPVFQAELVGSFSAEIVDLPGDPFQVVRVYYCGIGDGVGKKFIRDITELYDIF